MRWSSILLEPHAIEIVRKEIAGIICSISIVSYILELRFPSMKNGPIKWSPIISVQTLILSEYWDLLFLIQCGFSVLQYRKFWRLTFPWSSKLASSGKTMLFTKSFPRASISSQNSILWSKSLWINSCT